MKTYTIDLLTRSCAYQDDKLYCPAKDFNLLFSVDLQDGTVSLVDAVPDEAVLAEDLFGSVRIQDSRLVLTPGTARKAWSYDLDSGHWDSLDEPAAASLKPEEADSLPEEQYIMHITLDNGMTVCQTAGGDLSIQAEGAPERVFHISVEADRLKQFYKEKNRTVYQAQKLYTESPDNPMLSLDAFLQFTDSRTQDKQGSKGRIGKAIWEKIR